MKLFSVFSIFCSLAGVFAADVHFDKQFDPAAKYAAKDLARCLSRMTGKSFNVMESAVKYNVGDIIIVNDSKLEKQQWSFVSKDGKLYISGRGTPGIVYGIYTFLEKYADCSWPAPDVEIIPRNREWKLPEVNEKGKPAIMRREIYVGTQAPDWIWRMRNKENHRVAFNLNMRIGSPSNGHSFDVYVKAIKDPKLFGPKISGGKCSTLCMTNPEVRKIVLAELLKYIAADREKAKKQPTYTIPKIYEMSQADGPSWGECWCNGCKTITEKEGSYSAANLDFVNYIARGVREKYPDVIIQTFAYSYTQKPPKTLKAEDNVMIRYCDAHLFRPLVPGTPNAKELDDWNKFAAKKAIWSYWRIYDGYLYPFVKSRKDIAGELRLCVKDGVYHYFAENEDMLNRSFAIQQHYLGLKMMDDPAEDINKLNEKFMQAYYGKAAPFMLQYLEYLEKRQEKTRAFLDKEFFEKVNGWLDEAEKAVANDAKALLHVKCERVIVDRTMFLRLQELIKQGYKTDSKTVAQRFLENGIKQIDMWASIARKQRDALKVSLKGEAELYSHFPVALPERFKNCDVIDLHWNQLQRSTVNAVKDADAVCGMAVRNPKAPLVLPFKMGFYSGVLKAGSGVEFMKEDIPADEKFHWYKLGRTRILAPLYIYYDKDWRFRGWLSSIGVLGEERDIWISVKFQGKNFVDGSQKPNAVLFDRILLIKDSNLINSYKPVNPKLNILKNGSFDRYSKAWLYDWCKFDNNIKVDNVNKKHGRSALRIDGKAGVNVRLMSNIGKLADMKNDLLVRGWCKYENIELTGKYGHPYIGLWPLNAKGGNTTYNYSILEIYNGSSEWKYFEKIIDIEALKKAASRAKPLPGASICMRIAMYNQPGTLWLDNIEIIPLEKK